MFVSKNSFSILEGRYIFTDTDFLNFLFEDEKNFEESLSFFPKSYLTIDPLIKFEFLRDVFLPLQRDLKVQFVSTKEVFYPAISHHEIFDKIQGNALLLSKIYSHHYNRNAKNSGWSTIDLLLAGRAMYYWKSSAIITGNKKDFPSAVFDTIGVISYETNDNQIKTFSIIVFNKDKFEECTKALLKIQKI
jgi:hypothetical protein